MATENHWRAHRIQQELEKLGIHLGKTTISRYLPRPERLDHVVVFHEDHLRRLLREYIEYCDTERVHTAISDAPEGRAVEYRPSDQAKVVGLPRVGGLHHRYVWAEAA